MSESRGFYTFEPRIVKPRSNIRAIIMVLSCYKASLLCHHFGSVSNGWYEIPSSFSCCNNCLYLALTGYHSNLIGYHDSEPAAVASSKGKTSLWFIREASLVFEFRALLLKMTLDGKSISSVIHSRHVRTRSFVYLKLKGQRVNWQDNAEACGLFLLFCNNSGMPHTRYQLRMPIRNEKKPDVGKERV